MKRFLLSAAIVGLSAGSANAAVQTTYDRFKDMTTTSVKNLELGFGLKATVLFAHPGDALTQPMPAFSLGFISKRPTWEFMNSCEGRVCSLLAIVDGERVNLGPTDWDGTIGDGYVLEFMWAHVPRATFAKLAKAKSIEVQLAHREFSLPGELLQGFGEIYEVSTPEGAKRAAALKAQEPAADVAPAVTTAVIATEAPAAPAPTALPGMPPIPPGMTMDSFNGVLGQPDTITDVTRDGRAEQDWYFAKYMTIFTFDRKTKEFVRVTPKP